MFFWAVVIAVTVPAAAMLVFCVVVAVTLRIEHNTRDRALGELDDHSPDRLRTDLDGP